MSVDSDLVFIMAKKFGFLEKRVTYLEGKCRGQQGLIEKLQKNVRKFRKENKSRELVSSKVFVDSVDLKPDENSIQISNENDNLQETLEKPARNDQKLSQNLIVQMGVRYEENHFHNEMINPNRAIDRKSEIISQSKIEGPEQNAKNVKISSKPKGFAQICSFCSKYFPNVSTLLIHLRVHTGERPFKCTICPKAFKCKENLKCHYRIHTGEKPYSCSVCSRTFADHSTLRNHMKIHTGEKPYSCSICSRKFTQRSSLNYHRKNNFNCKK